MPKPPDPPPDPSPETLKRISEILHRHQIPPDDADDLLQLAVQEVAWRQHPNPRARDARLLRSVERRALAYRETIARQRLAEAAAETNGFEAHSEIDLEAHSETDPQAGPEVDPKDPK